MLEAPTQSNSEDAKRRTVTFYAPPKTFNLVGLVGSRRIVYNEAARGQRRMYESKCRCNGRNVLSMRAHRSLHSEGTNPDGAAQAGTENEHRVGRQLFQTEVLDGLLHSGVEGGILWRGGRQLRIPYGIRPALGLPAKQLEDTPHRLKNYVL